MLSIKNKINMKNLERVYAEGKDKSPTSPERIRHPFQYSPLDFVLCSDTLHAYM